MTAATVFAQSATVSDTATLNADFSPLAALSISSNTLAFPDADPDTVPQVPGTPASITITARARATRGAAVTLTVQASDDLRSGVDTIPIAAITWTASGPGFVAGTLSRATPQTVASWTGSGARSGTQNFLFANAWSYATGTYTVSLLYTLTAP
jgi:hypothetical protein